MFSCVRYLAQQNIACEGRFPWRTHAYMGTHARSWTARRAASRLVGCRRQASPAHAALLVRASTQVPKFCSSTWYPVFLATAPRDAVAQAATRACMPTPPAHLDLNYLLEPFMLAVASLLCQVSHFLCVVQIFMCNLDMCFFHVIPKPKTLNPMSDVTTCPGTRCTCCPAHAWLTLALRIPL